MASVVEIANRALQILGAGRITSLTDQSKNARAISNAYFPVRDALLRAHRWNFAIQRFMLAPSATAPAFGPTNAFPLPTGWLHVLPPDPQYNTNDRDWIIEGGSILSNQTFQGNPAAVSLGVRIVMKIEDPNQMDPLFREALSATLAEELAEELTQSNTKRQYAAEKRKAAISEAKKTNAIENVPQVAPDDPWITARI